MDAWRNGSASDSSPEGCVFDSRRVHIYFSILDFLTLYSARLSRPYSSGLYLVIDFRTDICQFLDMYFRPKNQSKVHSFPVVYDGRTTHTTFSLLMITFCCSSSSVMSVGQQQDNNIVCIISFRIVH